MLFKEAGKGNSLGSYLKKSSKEVRKKSLRKTSKEFLKKSLRELSKEATEEVF